MNNLNPASTPCVAGILAGGKSTRMGQPKASLTMADGKSLIEHVSAVAATITDQVVILGQAIPLPAPLGSLPVLPDRKPNGGPLAGLCSLLEYAADKWCLLLACDMPHLAAPVLQRLLREASPKLDAVVFERTDKPGTYHTCCALYHPRILPTATGELTAGAASLQCVLRQARKAVLDPTPDHSRQLTNVNTPEDLSALRMAHGNFAQGMQETDR